MAGRLIECVPNFSEGRDTGKVARIAEAMAAVKEAFVLDCHMDPDHNRSVITVAGPPEAVMESVLRGAGEAVVLIDLNRHRGVHPRIGAVDVVPFVPLAGLTMAESAAFAVLTGEQFWRRFRVPVYLYEAAARVPERSDLAFVRRGQFESLRARAPKDPLARPDIGGPELHPAAGASAIGARGYLVACNVVLETGDVTIARDIARRVRASSGGFAGVKALGVPLASRGLSQVTMNLTDIYRVSADELFDAIGRQAGERGVKVVETEIVGLVPADAYEKAPDFYRRAVNFRPDVILENRLAALQSK